MAAYTDEQIKSVCDKATAVLHTFTDAQNVTFPTTAIISGMKAGLDADTIANNARAAIDDLPLFNNGTYNTIGMNLVMFNYGSYLRGAVYNAIKELEGGQQEDPEPEVPTELSAITLAAESGSTKMFGHNVSDLQSNVAINGNKITGTLNNITSGSLVDTWGEGHFLALKFTASDWAEYTSVMVGLDPSQSSGLVEIINDPDKNGTFKVTATTQKFKIVATNGTKTKTQEYDLSDLVLAE